MGKKGFCFSVASLLPAGPGQFWVKQLTMGGVNYELAPLVRMTAPAGWRDRPFDQAPLDTFLFRSWILAFGFLPVDLHRLRFREVLPGERFLEESTSFLHRYWRHSRTIRAVSRGMQVRDEVCFMPRWPWVGYLQKPVFSLVFRHRHRRLQRRYGMVVPSS